VDGDRLIDTAYCQSHGNATAGHFAVLSVTDEGMGIPPETLSRIFDPLFSTKRPSHDGQKRGWGLAIVYTLVRRRGGWIDVESQPEEEPASKCFSRSIDHPPTPASTAREKVSAQLWWAQKDVPTLRHFHHKNEHCPGPAWHARYTTKSAKRPRH
jgi:signal transduction histidine kinase